MLHTDIYLLYKPLCHGVSVLLLSSNQLQLRLIFFSRLIVDKYTQRFSVFLLGIGVSKTCLARTQVKVHREVDSVYKDLLFYSMYIIYYMLNIPFRNWLICTKIMKWEIIEPPWVHLIKWQSASLLQPALYNIGYTC